MSDHYSNLGVTPDASADEIKSAFRQLAREFHPDRNPTDEAKSRFLSAKESYEILSNPERRAIYDRFRKPRAERVTSPDTEKPRVQTAGYFRGRKAWEDNPKGEVGKEEFLRRRRMVADMERLASKGRLAEAEAIANQLVDLGVKEAAPFGILGDSARLKGEFAEAAKNYGFAAQFDPASDRFRELSVAMMEAMARKPKPTQYQSDRSSGYAVLFGMVTVAAAVCYLAVAREPTIASNVSWISTWTLGQVAMSAVAGFAIGASMSAAGQIEHFDMGGGGSGYRFHPGVVVLVVSLANFWLATALYLLVGFAQRSFHAGVSKVVAGSAVATGALSMARFGYGWEAVAQAATWSGGIVYPAGLLGWLLADSLRRA